ncbi:MAG: ATP-binding cassette domain-containing protein [Ruminococcaceae bacterium]|nr:ATP-binding cassette domain-containing protein [Oscillospiraceae bacterium]
MAEAILTCRDLAVGYENGRGCSDIHFTVHEGDYICVIGQEGCGKSALMGAIMGIEKPQRGTIEFLNHLTARQIGCLPQNTVIQTGSTVWEIVMQGCLHRTKRIFVGRKEKELAQKTLERLGIASLAKRKFTELSGGGHRRVLLARALCAAERLLILDEPAYGLDVMGRLELHKQIAAINKEDNLAVMVIGTDGMTDATHVLHLGDSQIFFGTKEEYARSAAGQLYAVGRIL